MDDRTLRRRLWDGFARLQTLLGRSARNGQVLERDGLTASIVPHAPDSPALNAAVALEPDTAVRSLDELDARYARAGVHRWGIWIDGDERWLISELRANGLTVASASPGMGAVLDELPLDLATPADGALTDLATVGRVNDLAYGNVDARLERTLTALPPGRLLAYRAEHHGSAAAVALALHHDEDCGVSFVATVPQARRRGLATRVMRDTLADARRRGCTTVTLQATEAGERLYQHLGFRRLCPMELWERRAS